MHHALQSSAAIFQASLQKGTRAFVGASTLITLLVSRCGRRHYS
jgi:hypothetical protein